MVLQQLRGRRWCCKILEKNRKKCLQLHDRYMKKNALVLVANHAAEGSFRLTSNAKSLKTKSSRREPTDQAKAQAAKERGRICCLGFRFLQTFIRSVGVSLPFECEMTKVAATA